MPSCIKRNELFSILKRKFNNSLTFYKTGHKQYEKKTIYCCSRYFQTKHTLTVVLYLVKKLLKQYKLFMFRMVKLFDVVPSSSEKEAINMFQY